MSSRFSNLGLHAAAVLYTGGSIAQLTKLILDFRWQEMPFLVDWIIVVLGGVGAVTLIIQTPQIAYRGSWEKPLHFVIIAHLSVSVVLHLWTILVKSHDLYAMFPYGYSYFALLYFALFAWRSWTVTVEPKRITA